jgi:hypothetical protein
MSRKERSRTRSLTSRLSLGLSVFCELHRTALVLFRVTRFPIGGKLVPRSRQISFSSTAENSQGFSAIGAAPSSAKILLGPKSRHLSRHRYIDKLVEGYLVDHGTRIQQRIRLTQAYEMMDDCVKNAVIARLYGYSWSEIAKALQVKEQNLLMQYAFGKIREFTNRGSKLK